LNGTVRPVRSAVISATEVMISFSAKRQIYEALPEWTKLSVGMIPFAWLAGGHYRAHLAAGRALERASEEELRQFSSSRLSKLLDYATMHVSAYRKHRSAFERFTPTEALKDFPFLDKEIIMADQSAYVSDEAKALPHYRATTGGSTGRQMEIVMDNHSQSVELAFMHRQWERVGYTPRHRKATFRGTTINAERGVYWKLNPIYNELQFSVFHMTEANMPAYFERMRRWRPMFIHGYPSAVDMLAEAILRSDIPLPSIRAVLLGSEGTTTQQRERIEAAFKARVYTWYGHTERVVMAGECEYSSEYHAFPDYGLFEMLGRDGETLTEDGAYGEIVGTGFVNRLMPLIRYRTDDMARLRKVPCVCGRCWPRFSEVEGRWTAEYMTGRSGARITLTAVNMHGDIFANVIRFQYVHNEPGAATIRVQPAPGFGPADEAGILAAHHAKVGDEMRFSIECTDEIPLTSRGKLRRLVKE